MAEMGPNFDLHGSDARARDAMRNFSSNLYNHLVASHPRIVRQLQSKPDAQKVKT